MLSFLLSPVFHTLAAATCDKPRFLGLVPWYEYLTVQSKDIIDAAGKVVGNECKIVNFDPNAAGNQVILGGGSPVLLIVLAVIDDLVRVAALVAVGFIIYGGIQYITSQGSPDDTKQAQQTIINSLIGLVFALLAAALVGYIGRRLGGIN